MEEVLRWCAAIVVGGDGLLYACGGRLTGRAVGDTSLVSGKDAIAASSKGVTSLVPWGVCTSRSGQRGITMGVCTKSIGQQCRLKNGSAAQPVGIERKQDKQLLK